jgi:DNA-binding MarR family transcriptional regulator/N-acetylglutamate synthase-like GNAT family acetyltransferase
MPAPRQHERIQALRRFNRFYTRRIGILEEGVLQSPFSLTEVRVLYELAHREQPTAGAVADDLGLDPGYLSRILTGFQRRGLIRKRPSGADGRQNLLELTKQGRKAFAPLDARAGEQSGALLCSLAEDQQQRLIAATQTIERLLGGRSETDVPYLLRPHQPGDMGWVVHRHGVLYSQEYGYDERFEALVAEIVAQFIQNFDPKRERCWIAERDGEIVGSVFLVKKSAKIAKLRLLLVEPSARGLGIGRRLVEECIQFARRTGYGKVVLWTNEGLHAARHIYETVGFQLVHEEPHDLFGDGLVGQIWELKLK